MGLETARQDQLGRIDVSQIIGRGQDPNLNSAPATQALISAFRDGQLTSAEIADRAAKRPLVEAAADPELLAAQKQQALASSGMAQLQFQQATAMAKIPPRIQEMQAELAKFGLQTPISPNDWTDAASATTVKTWADVEDWKTQVAKVTAQKEIPKQTEATRGTQKVLVSTSKTSGTELDPKAVDQMEVFSSTFGKSPKAWIAAGKPPAGDLFPAAGAATTGVVGATGPGGGGGGTVIGTAEAKAPTENQAKAATAQARFISSNEVFENLKATGFDPAAMSNWTQELLIGPLAALKTADKRSFDAAKNSWAQGLLRLESGAAIAAKEQAWYEKTFFPTGLEPKAVQDQKAGMRADVEAVVAKLAESGHLDVPSLLKVRAQAETLDKLSSNGAFSGSPSRRTVMLGGKQYSVDNSDPGNPKLIGIGAAPTPGKYTSPESLRKPTVEPK